MAPVKCSYFNCNNTSAHKNLFRFPAKKEQLVKNWLANSGNPKLCGLNNDKLKNRYLCIDHFESKYVRYFNDKRKRLLKCAVPLPFESPENVDVLTRQAELRKQEGPNKPKRRPICIKCGTKITEENIYKESKQRRKLIKIAIPQIKGSETINITSIQEHTEKDDETILVLPIDELQKKNNEKSDTNVRKDGQTTVVIKLVIRHRNQATESINITSTQINNEKSQDETIFNLSNDELKNDIESSETECEGDENGEVIQSPTQQNEDPETISILFETKPEEPQGKETIRIVPIEELLKKPDDTSDIVAKGISCERKSSQKQTNHDNSRADLTERRGSLAAVESEARRGSGVARAAASRAPSERRRASPAAPRTCSRRGLSAMSEESSDEASELDCDNSSPYPLFPRCSRMSYWFPFSYKKKKISHMSTQMSENSEIKNEAAVT